MYLGTRQTHAVTALFSDATLADHHSPKLLLQQLWVIFLASKAMWWSPAGYRSFVVAYSLSPSRPHSSPPFFSYPAFTQINIKNQVLIMKFESVWKRAIKVLLTGWGVVSKDVCVVLFNWVCLVLMKSFVKIMSLPFSFICGFSHYWGTGIGSSSVLGAGRRHAVCVFSFLSGTGSCAPWQCSRSWPLLFAWFPVPWNPLDFSQLSCWKRGNTQ